jgi:hypothetical protein
MYVLKESYNGLFIVIMDFISLIIDLNCKHNRQYMPLKSAMQAANN